MLKGWISAGYHCIELGRYCVGNLGMKLKMCRIEHAVEGFRARQKSCLSLLIIPITYWAFKYQALCEMCYVRFR